MAVKKTSRKGRASSTTKGSRKAVVEAKVSASEKAAAKRAARSSAKKTGASTKVGASTKPGAAQSAASSVKRTSKKIVDRVLVKVSPQLQEKIDQLMHTLESSRRGSLGDLSLLAGKILVRAQDVSRSLRQLNKKDKKPS